MKDQIICVRPNRVLHVPKGNGQEIWARAGDFVMLDHELKHAWAKQQSHKYTVIDKLPKGAQIKAELPIANTREMAKFDHDHRGSGAASASVDVDGPNSALEAKVEALTIRVETLIAENTKLKLTNEPTTRKAAKSNG